MWSELSTVLNLGLLYMQGLTNGGQLKKGHEVIETHVFDRIYMFAPDRRRDD